MLKARYTKLDLQFKFPAGTSRGVLLQKPSSFIILEKDGYTGIGECSTIPDLSIDLVDSYVDKLDKLCRQLNEGYDPATLDVEDYPSIAFGLETALLDLAAKGSNCLFPSSFTEGATGIPINGLVWMGDRDFMEKQIKEKIVAGYPCIKLKIGANDFNTELEIIAGIRKQFSSSDIEIRLDANGAFSPLDALDKLNKLAVFDIHSIEQPIRQHQYEAMADICSRSPIPIVLDEELIGVKSPDKEELLQKIMPAYIILKPSLIGGLKQSEEWIRLAKKYNTGWWITSALEANIGLNAIAQWTATLGSPMPQGLGTGQLYHNNIPSPLTIENAKLYYKPEINWELSSILT
ncbi:MAG: o-succinylbenzoate synthase [Bacteroidota bacterium]|nr:o-succinylbenzoate synthase [Bacteroidota bacterium]